MKSYEDSKNICRACFNDTGQSSKPNDLFETMIGDVNAAKMFNECTSIEIYPDDGFPRFMCGLCETLLLSAYEFRMKCIQADRNYRQLSREPSEQTADIKPLIIWMDDTNMEPQQQTDLVAILDSTNIKSESNSPSEIKDLKEEDKTVKNLYKCNVKLNRLEAKIQCEHCERLFTTNFNLNRHIKSKHKIDLPNKNIESKGLQLKKQQNNKKHFKIKKESISLTRKLNIKSEDTSINTKSKKQCEHCDAYFTSTSNLNRHLSKKHKIVAKNSEQKSEYDTISRSFYCFACKKTFKNLLSLKAHIPIEHASYITKDKTYKYKCLYCPDVFSHWYRLALHVKLHTNAKYKCSFCNLTFGFRYEFNDHMLFKHDGARVFACLHCDEKFHSNTALHQHYRSHPDKMPYLCQECGKSFQTSSAIALHMQIHLNKDKYSCDKCPMKFAFKGRLQAHMHKHSAMKAFQCDLCGKTTSRKYVMENHMFVHTGERLLRFPCDLCSKRFKSNYHLVEHIRTHTGEKPFKCTFCIKAYAQKADLNKHLRTHVGENTYECDECLARFRLKKELENHKNEHYLEKIASNKD